MKNYTIRSTGGNFTVEATTKAAAISKAKSLCAKHSNTFISCIDSAEFDVKITKVAIWANEEYCRRWWCMALPNSDKSFTGIEPYQLSMLISDACDEDQCKNEILTFKHMPDCMLMVERNKEHGVIYVSVIGPLVEAMHTPLSKLDEDKLRQLTKSDTGFSDTIKDAFTKHQMDYAKI